MCHRNVGEEPCASPSSDASDILDRAPTNIASKVKEAAQTDNADGASVARGDFAIGDYVEIVGTAMSGSCGFLEQYTRYIH